MVPTPMGEQGARSTATLLDHSGHLFSERCSSVTDRAPPRGPPYRHVGALSSIGTLDSSVDLHPSGLHSVEMEVALQILGLVLSLIVLWVGLKRLELDRPWKAILGILDALVLVTSVVALGWLGFALTAIASLLGVLGWSIWLAAKKESLLVSAAIQIGSTKVEMEALHRRLYSSHRAFRQLGPIGLANLMRLVAARARQPEEIAAMAPPIAMLSVTQECEMPWLVEHFDRLLRLYGKGATESMAVADLLTVTTQGAAASFREIVEAMCRVTEPLIPS